MPMQYDLTEHIHIVNSLKVTLVRIFSQSGNEVIRSFPI